MPITELPRYPKARRLYGDRYQIRVRESVTVIEEAVCERCGGVMTCVGPVRLSNPPQFDHHCPECGCRATLRDRYPRRVEVRREEAQSE